jgi:hypothetical protein
VGGCPGLTGKLAKFVFLYFCSVNNNFFIIPPRGSGRCGIEATGGTMPEADRERCQVETYSGGRLHERPRRFTRGGEWLKVRRLLAQWREPPRLCFRVVAEDHHLYFLSYQVFEDYWEVEPAARGKAG